MKKVTYKEVTLYAVPKETMLKMFKFDARGCRFCYFYETAAQIKCPLYPSFGLQSCNSPAIIYMTKQSFLEFRKKKINPYGS